MSDINISQDGVATLVRWGEIFNNNCTFLGECDRTNIEYWPVFDEVMCRILGGYFFGPLCMFQPWLARQCTFLQPPVWRMPAGRLFWIACVFLSLFIKQISVKTAESCLAPYMTGRIGPDWEGRVRKFQTYPSRGFSMRSEKLSKKYAFSDWKFSPQNAL